MPLERNGWRHALGFTSDADPHLIISTRVKSSWQKPGESRRQVRPSGAVDKMSDQMGNIAKLAATKSISFLAGWARRWPVQRFR